jgi:hypothetical protein
MDLIALMAISPLFAINILLIFFNNFLTPDEKLLYNYIINTLGEKLAVFIEFKKEILQTYVLRMTEKAKCVNNYVICHSAAGEESHTFIEFLIRRV